MRKNSLNSLINDLDNLSKNFNNIFEKKYDDIMAKLFVLIGSTTAYDTGVSRDIIKSILSDLGRQDLQKDIEYKVYEFWKKRNEREKDNSDYSFQKVDGKYKIIINDYGIGNQQEGIVSDIHPRQDKNVIPNNIDRALDELETDANRDIVKAFNELEKTICRIIERGI